MFKNADILVGGNVASELVHFRVRFGECLCVLLGAGWRQDGGPRGDHAAWHEICLLECLLYGDCICVCHVSNTI
jgi:hypothetical protein